MIDVCTLSNKCFWILNLESWNKSSWTNGRFDGDLRQHDAHVTTPEWAAQKSPLSAGLSTKMLVRRNIWIQVWSSKYNSPVPYKVKYQLCICRKQYVGNSLDKKCTWATKTMQLIIYVAGFLMASSNENVSFICIKLLNYCKVKAKNARKSLDNLSPTKRSHTPVRRNHKDLTIVIQTLHLALRRCRLSFRQSQHRFHLKVALPLAHYGDVIIGAIASQITSLTIVYSTVYSDADQRKHQSSASLAFVWGIHRRPVNSPHKWPVTRKMFPFDDVIMKKAYEFIPWWVYSSSAASKRGPTKTPRRWLSYRPCSCP